MNEQEAGWLADLISNNYDGLEAIPRQEMGLKWKVEVSEGSLIWEIHSLNEWIALRLAQLERVIGRSGFFQLPPGGRQQVPSRREPEEATP